MRRSGGGGRARCDDGETEAWNEWSRRISTCRCRWHLCQPTSIVKDQVGYGIGLPLEEMSILRGDTKPVIQEGGVYALHAGIDDKEQRCADIAVVHVADDGARVFAVILTPAGGCYSAPGRSEDGRAPHPAALSAGSFADHPPTIIRWRRSSLALPWGSSRDNRCRTSRDRHRNSRSRTSSPRCGVKPCRYTSA